MKKIPFLLVLLGLVVGGGVFLALGGTKMKKNIQIRTETEPIYNHFPDLPNASEIQWCSDSSDGIGLSTVTIYIFAYYDHDIRTELQDIEIGNEGEDIELYFIPNGLDTNQKWLYAKDADFAFQNGIKNTQKMNTTVYVNEEGTILYIKAMGD